METKLDIKVLSSQVGREKTFDEKLIELVRKNPVLYNTEDKHYKNIILKEKIWEEISKVLKISVPKCRNRWKGLRDSYRRKKNKRESPSSRSYRSSKRIWRCEPLLSFLDDYQYSRRTIEDVSSKKEDMFEFANLEEEELILDETVQPSLDAADSNKHSYFLEKVTEAITTFSNNKEQSTATSTLFLALAKTIDDANLPATVRLEIQQDVSNLVFNKIREYTS